MGRDSAHFVVALRIVLGSNSQPQAYSEAGVFYHQAAPLVLYFHHLMIMIF